VTSIVSWHDLSNSLIKGENTTKWIEIEKSWTSWHLLPLMKINIWRRKKRGDLLPSAIYENISRYYKV
jgi:hypothetical protein